MQFQVVQCLVRLNQNGNPNLTEIVKSGPDAIPVTEIPILRLINDVAEGGDDEGCCINQALVVRDMDSTKANEIKRLKQKYGPSLVDVCYPGGRGMPIHLIDCELPESCLAPHKPYGEDLERIEREAAAKAGQDDEDETVTDDETEGA